MKKIRVGAWRDEGSSAAQVVKKMLPLSISLPLVRRGSRASAQPVETVREPQLLTRRQTGASTMRFMMLMIPKGYETGRAGRHAGRQGRCRDDEVQRIPAEGRRAARARWPPPALDGCPRLVLGREAQGDRRALHRGEGGDRRLLDDSGEVEGRGDRMGVALPCFGQRSDRGSPGAGVRRTSLPMSRRPRPGFPRCRRSPSRAAES